MSQFLDADIILLNINGIEKFHDRRRQSDGAFNKAVDIQNLTEVEAFS
jgi:hypothetical protein